MTALEVLAAHGVEVMIAPDEGDKAYTPTPVISHAILTYNRGRRERELADGIVITLLHNPPADGGFKYNPPNGGPADVGWTGLDPGPGQQNALLREKLNGVRRVNNYDTASVNAPTTHWSTTLLPLMSTA